MFISHALARPTLTAVLGSEAQHEADGEHFGPRRLPLLHQDPEQEGRVGQQEVLERLEGRGDVEEPTVFLTAQEALCEERMAQVAQHVSCMEEGEMCGRS